MIPEPSTGERDGFVPLTDDERTRIAALLATVSTRTLLKSLRRFHVNNEDADLILATLLDRLPFDERRPSD